MSKTIDQRVVEMRFDNAQFENGINQSMNSLDKLKESLDFSNLSNKGLNNFSRDISGIGDSVDSIASRFTTLGVIGTTALGKITSSAIDLGMSLKEHLLHNMEVGYDKYNVMMESIQTIMYGTREQIGEGLRWATQEDQMDFVTSQIEKLNWYTDETSYNLTDMTNSIGKFVANGVDLEDATTAMMGISSWAAMSGQNAEAASRAMYNLSQALSIGKVTVADWKSIELANMATTEFKHTVVDLAYEMGKLHETEEGWYATYNDKGKEVLVGYDSMRNSLSAGWFDNEVLTAVLKKYGDFADDLYDSVERTGLTATELLRYSDQYKKALADGKDMTKWMQEIVSKNNIGNYQAFSESLEKLTSEYNELGRQAFKAGQECKTFKDVLTYTEDAATSAWMGIYTAIFGNYLQSKELWTQMAEEMYFVAVESVDARRNLLQRWNDIGGRDHLVNALWDIWYNVRDVIEALRDAFADVFPEKNAVQLLSYAVDFERVMEQLRFIDFPWAPQLTMIQQSAQNIAEAVGHVVHFFQTIGESAYKAWQRIFPPENDSLWHIETRIIETILDITESIEKMTSVFEFTDEQADKLERTFAGLFAILDILRMVLVAIFEPLTGIEVEVVDIKDPILDVTAAIGDWLVALRDWVKEHNFFATAISTAVSFIKKIPGYIDEFLKKVFNLGLDDVWEMIKTGAYYAAGAVYMLFTNLPKYAEKATQLLFKMDLATFWQNLSVWIGSVWEIAKQFFFGITANSKEVTKSLTAGGFAGFWVKLVQWVLDAKITVWDFFGGLPGKINLVSKLLFHTDLKSFWDKFKGWIDKIGESVKKVFVEIIPEKANALSTFLFGSDLVTIWNVIKSYVIGVGESIKDFFTGLPGKIGPKIEKFKMKIVDIGTAIKEFFLDIPNKMKELKAKFEQTKVYAIWTKMKQKVQEAWASIKDFFKNFKQRIDDLSIKLFGSDIATWWNNLVSTIIGAWFKIKDFFTQLPDNLNNATQKLFHSDFKTFWENAKENITAAWDSVAYFFTHLPEEADKATQALFHTDFHSWWEDVKEWFANAKDNIVDFFEKLPGRVLTLKDHIEDLRQTVIKFFKEDIPEKVDELSNKLFKKDFASVVKDITDNVEKLKQAWKDFWGIGEEYEKPDYKWEGPGTGDDAPFLVDKKGSKYGKSGIDQIKNFFGEIGDTFSSVAAFSESDIGKVAKNAGLIVGVIGILIAAANAFLKLKKVLDTISTIKNVAQGAEATAKGGSAGNTFWGNFLGGFLNPFKDVAAAAEKGVKNISKIVMIKMIADAVLEIAGAILLLASIADQGRMWSAFAAIALLLAGIAGLMLAVSSEKFGSRFKTKDLLTVGLFFDLLAGAMVEIAGALWIAGKVEPSRLIAAVDSIALLFGAIGGLAIFFSSGKMDFKPEQAILFAAAMTIMAAAMVEIAGALWILKDIDGDTLMVSVFALTLLMGVIFGLMVAVDKIGVAIPTMLAFGGAIGMIGMAAALTGAGIWLVCDGIEKLSNIGPEGVNNITNGIVAFSEALPELATNVVAGLAAAAAAFSENKETFKQAALDMADIIMSVLELCVPRLLDIVTGGFKQLLHNAEGLLPDIMSFLTALLDNVLDLILTYTPKITHVAITLLIDTLTQIMEHTAEFTALLIEIALETIVGTLDGLGREIPRIIDALWRFIIACLNGVADGIEQHTDEFKAALIRVKNAISYFFVEIFGFDPFEGTEDDEIGSLVDFGSNIVKNLATGLDNALQTVKDAAGRVANGVLEKICEIFGVDKEDLKDSKTAGEIAMTLINGLVNKFVPEDIKKKIHEWADKIIEFVCDTFGLDKDNLMNQAAEGKFFEIAGQVMAGFINGIKSKAEEIKNTVGDFCGWVIDTATGKEHGFDVNSPSKVFTKIGQYVDEGFAKGVKDNLFMATDATGELAQEAIDGVSNAITSISDVINTEMDTEPTIRPVLDLSNITDGAGLIDGMLNSNRTMNMAIQSSGEVNKNISTRFNTASAFEALRNTLSGTVKNQNGTTINNTFYVTGDNPQDIAEEISHILQGDVDRRNAVWGM